MKRTTLPGCTHFGVERNGDGVRGARNGSAVDEARSASELGARAAASLPDALEHYQDIRQRLSGKRPAIFLDYDGTLTPIVSRPELAVLSEDTRATLRRLAGLFPVAVVSGRDRADVERLVGLGELIYAGSHGFDIVGPAGLNMAHPRAAEFLPALDRAESRLRQTAGKIEGALVERKRFAIAVHYRLVADIDLRPLEEAVDAVLEPDGKLRKTGGKKVFELRPQLAWDKGRAVSWLLDTLSLREAETVPFYIGDDETDEDAFAAMRDHAGVGILVANQACPTKAHYYLSDTDAVVRFLVSMMTATRAS